MLQIAAADELQRVPVDPDARREGLAGDRAAHAQPARAPGGGGRAQPRGHPHRRADRAADARASTTHRAGRASCWSSPRRPGPRASAAWRCTCAARCARCSWTGCDSSDPISCLATNGSTARGAYAPADGTQAPVADGRAAVAVRGDSCDSRPRDRSRRVRGRCGQSPRSRLLLLERAQRVRALQRSAHAGLAGGHFIGDLVAAGATADGRASSGATPAMIAPTRTGSGATSTSPRLRSIAADRPRGRRPRGCACRRSVGARAATGEHAGVADEAREHGESRRRRCRAGRRADRRRSRAGRTWSRCRSRRGRGRLAAERGHEHQVAAAARRPSPGISACASAIGARRLTVERAVDLLHREGLERSRRRQRGVGDQDVDLAGLAGQALDLAGLAQVDRPARVRRARRRAARARPRAVRSGSACRRAGERASDRLPDAAGGAGEKHASRQRSSSAQAYANTPREARTPRRDRGRGQHRAAILRHDFSEPARTPSPPRSPPA